MVLRSRPKGELRASSDRRLDRGTGIRSRGVVRDRREGASGDGSVPIADLMEVEAEGAAPVRVAKPRE